MVDTLLKTKIHKSLRDNYFKDPEDLVDVSESPDHESIHVVVVSRKFDGRRLKEKNDLIWSVLLKQLTPEEWGKVTLSVGASPEEVKGL